MGESERVQLARSLHDGIAQELVALSYRIQLMEMRSDLTPELAAELRELHLSISSLTASIRDELLSLRNPVVRDTQERLARLIERLRYEGEFTFTSDVDSLPLEINDALIELMRNSLTHARASRIELSIVKGEGHLLITFRDNGIGGAEIRDEHFGLVGIQESIAALGGELVLQEDGGTIAWMRVPTDQS